MLDSIYHMTLKLLLNHVFHKNPTILVYICKVITSVITKCYQNLYTTSGLSILMHGVISLPDI